MKISLKILFLGIFLSGAIVLFQSRFGSPKEILIEAGKDAKDIYREIENH